MTTKLYLVDLDKLKKVSELGNRCLCCLANNCPCDEFLTTGICRCGVYKEI